MAGEKAHHDRCEEHGHAHAPLSDVAAMMDRARAFAAARKIPFTEMRARVLTVLAREAKPLTAYEIVDRLSDPKKVQAVQVYRALDFLQEAGCVHRLASKASYFACDHEHHSGDAVVFMVCSHCGTVQEAPSDLVAQGLQGAAEHAGFRPVHPIVELEGECARCLETRGDDARAFGQLRLIAYKPEQNSRIRLPIGSAIYEKFKHLRYHTRGLEDLPLRIGIGNH